MVTKLLGASEVAVGGGGEGLSDLGKTLGFFCAHPETRLALGALALHIALRFSYTQPIYKFG